MLVTGSALVYRPSPEALTEDVADRPVEPLRREQARAGDGRRPARRRHVILARPFNHAGPRQSPAYVTSSFARQIAEIEAGLARAGAARRQPRCAPRHHRRARHRPRLPAAGRARPAGPALQHLPRRAYRIGDLLESLLGRPRVPIRSTIDPARLRPSDNPVVLGDPRAARATKWAGSRAIPIDETLTDLLDYWRHASAGAAP